MTDKRQPTKSELFLYASIFAAVIGAFAFFAYEPGERLGFVIFVFAVTAFGIASAVVPAVKTIGTRFVSACFLFAFWILFTTGPIALFRAISAYVLDSASALVQVLVLVTWGILLIGASFVVMYASSREYLFNRMHRIGFFAPVLYSLNLLMISVQFFATWTFLLHQYGRVTLLPGSAAIVSAESFGDFFVWHFLNAVPVLKITDTILWNEPLLYSQASVGWMLLAFKVSVIMPVLAAFTWSWLRFRKGG